MKLGQRASTPDGREYVYLQASVALAPGQLLIPISDVSVSSGLSSGTNAIGKIVYINSPSAGWTPGQFEDQEFYISAGTGIGQGGKIAGNSSSQLTLYPESALATALDGTSVLQIVQPGIAKLSVVTSKIQRVIGCAQITVPINYYFWALTEGDGLLQVGASTLTIGTNFTAGDGTTAGSAIVGVTGQGPFDAQNLGFTLRPNTASNTIAWVRFLIRG